MNPVHLETLLAIVEEGSFEVAASVLGISPSAVSQRIKALEASTGRVLVRRANPVGATEAGEVLVQAARRMALVQAETDARLGQRLARVPLSVAINSDSLATWFTQVLSDTAQRGDVALRIRIEDEARTLAMLRRGDVLGAVTREHSPVSGCDSTFLGTMRYFAVAAPHIAEGFHSGRFTWETMPLVGYGPNDQVLDDAMRERFIDSHVVRARVSQIPSSEGYLEAVRVGLGWGLLPQAQAQPLVESKELLLLDDHQLDIDLYWQRWRLESEVLSDLTRSVINAAAGLGRA
ncbi:ArgP/LysG family DNA-binding transcriptional regulator [Corynebacterium accolens]|jgi:transcriptional regulator, argP family|uniref:ArgP/LysG family DNA-binding transcriptional regulator n=1 Tax=Corynebacterium accolens TaxID=38284 RepID=A0ABT7FRZ5_9CORY|nr:ArgP/LysG family DNA-binding transcriptional regulator [Corynebacterium accolens]MDK4248172.1 ArgP/LysG family DNA-binding transcriptional regulator [Corynebacterium accolens]MDK4310203.1 ArgP/LysG family DNA-binding transcriptional regulator [Corynebacterium accolens]MDK4323718.1 ArgP/LysG family DNA-binding transcriptional regulator [Corynebacterium accolens]MDK8470347.1 ArgP/LysG family DNA-binding transcriptional regulator [Corynebacterium accolens]MDK8498419.1 ArgP/LysG family DNA-bind